jgi:5-methylthioadenosine/S-adenosylhomocysteine deaminase
MTTLLKDGIVVTVNAEFRVYPKASVLIHKDRILDIGFTHEVLARNAAPTTIIDASDKIIAPGFISAHNHLGYTLYRGRAEDVGSTPTPSLFLPMKPLITRADRAVFAALGATELLRGGVTTVLEMEEDADVVAPLLEKIGLRAGIAIMTNDIDVQQLMTGATVFDAATRQQQVNQTLALVEAWHGAANGRLTAFVAANMALSCSAELLKALRSIADQFGIGATYHVGLGAYEVDLVQQLHGCRPFDFARQAGFLNADTIVAHCHYMNDVDLGMLAKSGAHVVHCPVLNSLRAAQANIAGMLAQNIPVSLGLDNYFADYFDVMRACIAVARVRERDSTLLSAKDVLRFATIEAAKAMGLARETGSLEIGKKADLQIINTRRLGLAPITDIVSSLVYHAHAEDVDTVMVDGQILVANGMVQTINVDTVIDQAQAAADSLWSRFAKTYPHNPTAKAIHLEEIEYDKSTIRSHQF